MKRKAFFSFHYKQDNWKGAQVRNIGIIEGNSPVSDNDWEKIKNRGHKIIQNWIDSQLKGRSCTIVLIGEKTAGRKWIKYEIRKSWEEKKGLLGIYVHNLKDKDQKQSQKGSNPFDDFKLGDKSLSNIVKAYDPPYKTSKNVYNYISENIEKWIEDAIEIRNKY